MFAHSPVYRISGDEFLAVLQDTDYKNREILVNVLREKASEAKEKEAPGSVSMTAGMAVYDPESDASVAEVLQRAVADAEKRRQS